MVIIAERVCLSLTAPLDAQVERSPDDGQGTSVDPGRKSRLTQQWGSQDGCPLAGTQGPGGPMCLQALLFSSEPSLHPISSQ